MIVLGIDPGLSRCGYACVEAAPRAGRAAHARAIGVIRSRPEDSTPRRLAGVHEHLRELIAEHRPDVVAIERVFFTVNVSTGIGVAQVSGLAAVEGIHAGAEVVEYTPNQVKEAVAGWGAADKRQMQDMVTALLALDRRPSPADAADAAAVALCHLAHAPFRGRVGA